MSIDFYGRAIDEAGQPVPDADVSFGWNDTSLTGTSHATARTDAHGFFSLRKKTGKLLQVDVVHANYYQTRDERLRSFEFADFSAPDYYVPDGNNPIVFHLRKRGLGQPLSEGEISEKIPAEGRPVRFDLTNRGQVSPEGQLEIATVTNTEKYPPRRFDWHAIISVPAGGLQEHAQEFPFEAPVDGYQPRVELDMPATSPEWKRVLQKDYFIRFGTPPNYGRIRVRLDGGSQFINIHYWFNSGGSSKLEPESAQQAHRLSELP